MMEYIRPTTTTWKIINIFQVKKLSEILKRNMFPKWLTDKLVEGYLSKVRTTGEDDCQLLLSCHFRLISAIILLDWKKTESHPL